MPKMIAKPRTPFMLILDGGETLEDYRPSVVTPSDYLLTFQMKGSIEVLAPEIPEEATDAEFLKFWLDSDRNDQLAVEAFVGKWSKSEEQRAAEEQARLEEEEKARIAAEKKSKKTAE